MSYFILYLCSVASSVKNIFCVFSFFGFIGSVMIIVWNWFYYADRGKLNMCKPIIKKVLKFTPIFVITSFLWALIPDTKQCYAIFGIGTTIECIQNNQELNKIPNNAFKAINYYLEEITKDKKNNEEK